MNPKPSPEPLPLIPTGLSVVEFDQWIKADPRNLAARESLAELVVAAEPGVADEELRRQSESLLANRRERVAPGTSIR